MKEHFSTIAPRVVRSAIAVFGIWLQEVQMIVVFVVLSMGHDVCVQGTAAISQLLGLGTP